jgi:hypothetical protein
VGRALVTLEVIVANRAAKIGKAIVLPESKDAEVPDGISERL